MSIYLIGNSLTIQPLNIRNRFKKDPRVVRQNTDYLKRSIKKSTCPTNARSIVFVKSCQPYNKRPIRQLSKSQSPKKHQFHFTSAFYMLPKKCVCGRGRGGGLHFCYSIDEKWTGIAYMPVHISKENTFLYVNLR